MLIRENHSKLYDFKSMIVVKSFFYETTKTTDIPSSEIRIFSKQTRFVVFCYSGVFANLLKGNVGLDHAAWNR